ncbi:MAG TPA: tetratricopeptide repeat protein [Saprospiraceae bacterium]|nr:tetratricopeptide repeat protein [Saprospiraceae bacterium]
MKSKKVALLLSAFLIWTGLFAQQTTVYTDAELAFKRGLEFYDQGLLAKAKREFNQAIQSLQPINEEEAQLLRSKAELLRAKIAVRLERPEGEKLTLNYIRENRPDPEYDKAIIDVANYYFDQRKYDMALSYYQKVPNSGLSQEQLAEVRFKQGYAYFRQEEYDKAKSFFRDISRNRNSEYYEQTNYYLGLCYFYEGNYSQAVNNFNVVVNDDQYSRDVPYYIAQIYFAQRQWDQLINYIEPRIYDTRLRNRTELNQLLGQAYFEKGNYEKALPYLEEYNDRSSKLREEELYQLGYAQYQTGDYRKAVQSLKPLTTANSPIGQNAMFYLADCYLKLGNKQSALTSLASAKRLDFDPQIQEEALFNHAKLAYELGQPQEAVRDLQMIPVRSQYYNQAQTLLGEIFLSYRDYRQALAILQDMRTTTNNPQILETFQKVATYRGIQLLKQGDLEEAERHFRMSMEAPIDPNTKAMAHYWLGEIAHRRENYVASTQELDRFLTLSRTADQLPEESSVFTANYLQGYNYLKIDNYEKARGYFQQTVDGIENNRRFLGNEEITNKVLGDAVIRLGDSYFKFNQYDAALRYYNKAINSRYSGYDYAMYQKGIIEGLKGRRTEEIVALEELVRSFPNSAFADDALYRLGSSYQEVNQLARAETPLKRLVSEYRNRSPLINQAYIKLGLISYNRGNLNAATEYYKKVFANNPTPEEAQVGLAALEEIYVRDLGRPEDYFAFLETVPGYKPDNFSRDSITFMSAESRFENGDYQRAIASYTDYLQRYPRGFYVITARFHRGESYSVLRQYSEALQDYEWVVDQGQSSYYLKALQKAAIIAYNHELDFGKSFELYTKLEEVAESDEQMFEAQLGALRSAYRSDNKQALYTYANKVTQNSRATELQRATAYFYLGKIAYDQANYDQALNSFEQVVAMSDNEQTAEARYLIADIYYKKRNLDKAQELTIKANQESSAYPFWVAKSVLLLAEVFAEKGDLYNARAALEALLENYDQNQEIVSQAQRRLGEINRMIDQSSKLSQGSGTNNNQ